MLFLFLVLNTIYNCVRSHFNHSFCFTQRFKVPSFAFKASAGRQGSPVESSWRRAAGLHSTGQAELKANSEHTIQCASERAQSSVASTKLGTGLRPHYFFILSIALLFALCAMPLSAANAATVTLAWDPNTEPELSGYRIHYGTTSGSYDYSVDVGNYTSCTISGLAEGTTYYFAATAYDSGNGESAYSNELAYTIPIPPSPPPLVDTDGDGILDNDEIDVYGTDPDISDTDNDGISDGEELSYWANQWNMDYDGDGIVNLLDPDSDDDGVSDGLEINQGTDPTDQLSIPASAVVFAVNTGGSEYVDTDGIIYEADTLFSGGKIFASATNISNTEDDTLYKSERYGNFSYDIPVANGNYLVTFKFAEIYHNGAGRRIFNVEMEENEVIGNLDLFAQVGKYTAHDVAVPVSVLDGVLNISFYTVKDNAKVGAIVVELVNSDPPSDPPDEASEVVFAVNTGGSEYVDTDGIIYQADSLYSGGKTFVSSTNINGTEDGPLYKSERYGNFSYDIPVANGNYLVTFKFAEIYHNGDGRRIFDVEMEENEVIGNLDVFAQVGKYEAYDVTAPVDVKDGVLNIDFYTGKDNAKVGAIVVEKVGSDPPPNEALEVVFAVNPGGSEYVDADGIIYQSDSLYSGGKTFISSTSIDDTEDDPLYQSERYGNFSYDIPLANGSYLVTLKFAEIYHNDDGRRIFDVEMEGNEAISNLDVFARVGKYAAYDVTVPVDVEDGILNIEFYTDKDNAKVSAILIIAQ